MSSDLLIMPSVTVAITGSKSSAAPCIPITLHMHTEARNIEDLWSGRAGSETRRKLQNRLNQRAFRKRRAIDKASKAQVFYLAPAPVPQEVQASNSLADHHDDKPSFPHYQPPDIVTNHKHNFASWCRPLQTLLQLNEPNLTRSSQDFSCDVHTETVALEESLIQYLKPSDYFRLPADDQLLSLMYYNVFRALTTNVRLLGLDIKLMHTESYPSPFIAGTACVASIPPHLRPTKLQCTVPHHPCFDIFPDPIVRDHGVRNSHRLPHGKLCMTLAGRNTWYENDRNRRHGLVIWGPPEDANSWEVSEGFVSHWGWLVQGSAMLQHSTNRWRAARGEGAIYFA